MKTKYSAHESYIAVALLCLSGGFQDAYTYNCRGNVFANAQTGNMVLFGQHLLSGNFAQSISYFFPILAFALGIFFTSYLGNHQKISFINWRQTVILIEAAVLFIAAFLPQELNNTTNMLVSFSCAMQVQAFRTMAGQSFATTMCIGNLRSAVNILCDSIDNKDKHKFKISLKFFAFIGIFILGAAIGGIISPYIGDKSLCFCLIPLTAVFFVIYKK